MNLQTELLREHSARQTQRLADYACAHPSALAELLQLFWYGPGRERQLAAAQPSPGQHPALRRAVARVLQFVPVPDEWQALAFDTCLALLRAPTEPVAVRAYALTAAVRLAGPYSELAAEAIYTIRKTLTTSQCAALHRRAGRELPKLMSLVREHSIG